MRLILSSLSLVLYSFVLMGQERHPIDQMAYNRLQEAVSNADMINAEKEAYDHWDHLLNIVYQEAEKEMLPATFAALRESQRAWLKYRDAEFKVINQLYYAELQGTMWYAPAAGARKRIVRQRVLSLLDQLSLLKMQTEEDSAEILGKWISTQPEDQTSILEIREDFTVIWSDQNSDRYDVEFYQLSDNCSGQKENGGQPAISLMKPGLRSEKRCYFLTFDGASLGLSLADGTTSFRFRRSD